VPLPFWSPNWSITSSILHANLLLSYYTVHLIRICILQNAVAAAQPESSTSPENLVPKEESAKEQDSQKESTGMLSIYELPVFFS
jgi:hypothetical protein